MSKLQPFRAQRSLERLAFCALDVFREGAENGPRGVCSPSQLPLKREVSWFGLGGSLAPYWIVCVYCESSFSTNTRVPFNSNWLSFERSSNPRSTERISNGPSPKGSRTVFNP